MAGPDDFSPDLAKGVARVVLEFDFCTGFLLGADRQHIVTAQHILNGRDAAKVHFPEYSYDAVVVASDPNRDLALLKLETEASAAIPGLPISDGTARPGHMVYTWGFPAGVFHHEPLLTVGYLAGAHTHTAKGGTTVERWYVNAAFNNGNSGGPLLLDGAVIGVVSRKVAPLKSMTGKALAELKGKLTDVIYSARINGNSVEFTEGEIIHNVLEEFRQSQQLGLGAACASGELRNFLSERGIQLTD